MLTRDKNMSKSIGPVFTHRFWVTATRHTQASCDRLSGSI